MHCEICYKQFLEKRIIYGTACLLELAEFMQQKYNSSSVQINRTMKYSFYTWQAAREKMPGFCVIASRNT